MQVYGRSFANTMPLFIRDSGVWWRTLVIPVLGRLRQEDRRFKDSLGK